MSNAKDEGELSSGLAGHLKARREEPSASPPAVLWVLLSGACYYLATEVAWALCFPNSKVSLFFPPHAVLVSVLLLVPVRHWWAYTLAAICGHFLATRQAHWPILYSLHCEIFDAVKIVAAAAGIRLFIKSPLTSLTLRDAIVFVLIAVVIVPLSTAFWGAAFTLSNHYGTDYWIEWRNLGVSNGVTAIVLVPAFLFGVHQLSSRHSRTTPGRLLEASLLAVGLLTVGVLVFQKLPAGPDTSPALLYAPIPFLIWAALRFGLGGTSASMVLVTIQAIWGTMHGRGPFLMQSPSENALALQLFLLVTATPLMFLAIVVEEEKRSQHALRLSEERYREVVECQTELVCRYLADSTLTFANDSYCRFLGRTREELLGRKLLEFIPLHAREAMSNHIASLNRASCEAKLEIEVTLPDEKTAWYQWTGYPVTGADGEVVEFQAVGHDISDRKHAEEARRNLAHATRVSTMGALAGSLAHELNQPLTAILSNAQAGVRFLGRPAIDLAEVRSLLDDIAQDATRAGGVIRQLRTLVKKDKLQLELLDLNRLIHDVARLLHSDLVIKKVQLLLALDSELPPVRGVNVQLQQVLLNLLLNAFDAMAETAESERKVHVRTGLVEDGMLQVEVDDRGTGMQPALLARLFEAFHSTKPDGLGLGLFISRSIVEAHGGRLWAANNPERGLRVYFTVPVAKEERTGEAQGLRHAVQKRRQ